MNLPDEITLKEEIREIADKIDSIINTVNKVYPMDTDSAPALNEHDDSPDN